MTMHLANFSSTRARMTDFDEWDHKVRIFKGARLGHEISDATKLGQATEMAQRNAAARMQMQSIESQTWNRNAVQFVCVLPSNSCQSQTSHPSHVMMQTDYSQNPFKWERVEVLGGALEGWLAWKREYE